jgi:enoyl-CoA hydratase
MPRAAVELLRQRLTPAHFNRAVTLAEQFSPANAVEAGFLDRIVEPGDLGSAARDIAAQLTKLDLDAHKESKLRARHQTLEAVRAGTQADYASFRRTA